MWQEINKKEKITCNKGSQLDSNWSAVVGILDSYATKTSKLYYSILYVL